MARSRLSSWMKSPWTWLLLGLFAAVSVAGPSHWPAAARADVTSAAQADITQDSPQKQFLSGGARSEVVLREISETLKRIDGRLERMENAVRAVDEAGREPADKDAAK
jgi:hypothetical protein